MINLIYLVKFYLSYDGREKIMLVLTRQLGERIMIDNNIKIQILNINGRSVQIGIDAPQNISIYREELYNRIQGLSVTTLPESE